MKLTRVRAEGLHGGAIAPIDHPIPPGVVVVRGPNESGKTTLIRLPELIARGNAGTRWPLLGDAPDYEWWATLEFEREGRPLAVSRGIRGTHWATIDGRPASLKDAAVRIAAMLGEAHTFDLAEFCGLSPAKRLAWMEARILDGATWDRERLFGEMAAAGIDQQFAAAGLTTPEGTAREALVRLIAQAKEARLEAGREKQRLTKAIEQQRTEAAAADLPVGTVAQWRAKQDALAEERGELERQLGKVQGAKDALAAQERARIETERALVEAQAQIEAFAGRRADLAARVDALTAAAAQETEAVRPLREALDAAESAYLVAVGHHKKQQGAVSLDSLREQGEAIIGGWPDDSAPPVDLPAARQLAVDCAALPDERPVQEAAKARRAAGAAFDAREAVRAGVERDLNGARREADRLREQEDAARATVDRLQRQAGELAAAQAEAAAGSEEGAREALAGLRVSADEARQAIDRLTDHAQAQALRLQRQAELEAAERRRVAAGEAERALLTILERMLAEVVQPFLAPVSAITEAVLGCAAYAHLDGGFAFGCRRLDGTLIPWETCSESQQVVLLLAVSAAVQARLGGWRRLVVDGLECMDDRRRHDFLLVMAAVCRAGGLDNVLCACVDTDWTLPDGIAEIRL